MCFIWLHTTKLFESLQFSYWGLLGTFPDEIYQGRILIGHDICH